MRDEFMGQISQNDINNLRLLRENINLFLEKSYEKYAQNKSGLLLDIAPQDHMGASPFFLDPIKIETLDINPDSRATYIADLCDCSNIIGINRFDFDVCTEVLEHTLQPFNAVDSIYKVLKSGGYAFISTPFNFRIHGPLPDCWRFTEHGLRELFKKFKIIELNSLESSNRFLMPIQYTLVVQK